MASASKFHLLTHMLLRVPGFSPRPSWARTNPQNERFYQHPRTFGGSDISIFDIDSYNPNDGNWWCPADIDRIKMDMAEEFYVGPLTGRFFPSVQRLYIDPLLPAAPFHPTDRQYPDYKKAMVALADRLIAWHPLLKDADFAQLGELAEIPNGPKLLSEQALTWARGSNWLTHTLHFDKYLPETLHLAVRSTRYGCRRQGGHGSYSRAAFEALHRLYPHSMWTTQTPYWFDKLQAR